MNLAAKAKDMASVVVPEVPGVGMVLVLTAEELFNYIQDRDARSTCCVLELPMPEADDVSDDESDDDRSGRKSKEERKKEKKAKKKEKKEKEDRSLVCGATRIQFTDDGTRVPAVSTDPPDCWHGADVVVYSRNVGIKDPTADTVLSSLVQIAKGASSIAVLSVPYFEFKRKYPFMCSKHKDKPRRFPSEVLPGRIYLGDMKHAEDTAGLEELGVSFVISIYHERPKEMKLPRHIEWLYLELPDSERADISQLFERSCKFLKRCEDTKSISFIHCGKGMSRSSTLIAAHLMKYFGWDYKKTFSHMRKTRPIVAPNAHFQAQLREYSAHRAAAPANSTGAPSEGGDAPPSTQIHMDQIKLIAGAARPGTKLHVKKDGEIIDTIKIDKKPIYICGRGDEQRKKLGRSAIDIEMKHPSISRKHAIIFHDKEGHCFILDCHSSHGTRLNGDKIPGGEAWKLVNGAVVRFGASTRDYELSGTGSKWDDVDDGSDNDVPSKRARHE